MDADSTTVSVYTRSYTLSAGDTLSSSATFSSSIDSIGFPLTLAAWNFAKNPSPHAASLLYRHVAQFRVKPEVQGLRNHSWHIWSRAPPTPCSRTHPPDIANFCVRCFNNSSCKKKPAFELSIGPTASRPSTTTTLSCFLCLRSEGTFTSVLSSSSSLVPPFPTNTACSSASAKESTPAWSLPRTVLTVKPLCPNPLETRATSASHPVEVRARPRPPTTIASTSLSVDVDAIAAWTSMRAVEISTSVFERERSVRSKAFLCHSGSRSTRLHDVHQLLHREYA